MSFLNKPWRIAASYKARAIESLRYAVLRLDFYRGRGHPDRDAAPCSTRSRNRAKLAEKFGQEYLTTGFFVGRCGVTCRNHVHARGGQVFLEIPPGDYLAGILSCRGLKSALTSLAGRAQRLARLDAVPEVGWAETVRRFRSPDATDTPEAAEEEHRCTA